MGAKNDQVRCYTLLKCIVFTLLENSDHIEY